MTTLAPLLGQPAWLPAARGLTQSPREAISHMRLRLADGRQVSVAEYGRRGARPIVYLHGFLGSRLEPLAALRPGANIIAIDRPGYGHSSLGDRPSLARFANGLGETLDILGIERCGVVGVSAGAPYAVAAAAVLGRRVERCVLAAGVAGSSAVARSGGSVRLFATLRSRLALIERTMPAILRHARRFRYDGGLMRLIIGVHGERFGKDVDPAAVTRGLIASMREGMRAGIAGSIADMTLLSQEWDVDPAAIKAPVLVLHGSADHVVPCAHAAWYAAALPDAHVQIVEGAGHVSLVVDQAERIVRALAA